jgi:hypothetical protein
LELRMRANEFLKEAEEAAKRIAGAMRKKEMK